MCFRSGPLVHPLRADLGGSGSRMLHSAALFFALLNATAKPFERRITEPNAEKRSRAYNFGNRLGGVL